MMEENNNQQRVVDLEAEVEALKGALEEQQQTAETKRLIDFAKVKGAVDEGAKKVLEAIKPVIEKYEEPSRAAVAKVGGKVSDNPFLSVIVAFGAGIIIGKVLDCCCRHEEE